MDRKEAILRIKDHMEHHGIGKYPHLKLKEALDMAIAALSQPNEPMTLEQLREMDGEPVYIIIDGVEPLKMWVLIEVDGEDIYLTNNLGGRSYYEEARELYKFKLYRRPPEGEEDA